MKKRIISLVLALIIACSILVVPVNAARPSYVHPFVDVPSSAPYADAVKWAVNAKITSGTNATHFSPNANVTFEQMITFLWRAQGAPYVANAQQVINQKISNKGARDAINDYAKIAVAWALKNNIVRRTDVTSASFVNGGLSKNWAILFLYRSVTWPDHKVSDEYLKTYKDYTSCKNYESWRWALGAGIISGTDNTHLKPNNIITRAEAVSLLKRFKTEMTGYYFNYVRQRNYARWAQLQYKKTYSQPNRWGPNSFDCSSLVFRAIRAARCDTVMSDNTGYSTCTPMRRYMNSSSKWTLVASGKWGKTPDYSKLQYGDVIHYSHETSGTNYDHTAIYIGTAHSSDVSIGNAKDCIFAARYSNAKPYQVGYTGLKYDMGTYNHNFERWEAWRYVGN